MKKAIMLATIAGFALSTAAFAQTRSPTTDAAKNDKPAAAGQPNADAPKVNAAPVSPQGTTGAGQVTTSDPRDSNAVAKTPADKSRLEDAKQKGN